MTDWTPVSPVNPTIYVEPNRPGSGYNPPVVVQIPGPTGKSAYQHAVDNGFVGTEAEWLASLKGAKGDTGDTGPQGIKGDTGDPGIHVGPTPPADTTIAWVNTS